MSDSNSLIPAEREPTELSQQNDIQSALGAFFGQSGAYLCNFPADPQERFYLQSDALAEDIDAGDEWPGLFQIQYWYVHAVQVERDGGELVECLRTVLFDPKGNRIKFVSDGVATDIRRIAQTFGMRPYNPPVTVEVCKVKTGRGRRLLRLRPVRPDRKPAAGN